MKAQEADGKDRAILENSNSDSNPLNLLIEQAVTSSAYSIKDVVGSVRVTAKDDADRDTARAFTRYLKWRFNE